MLPTSCVPTLPGPDLSRRSRPSRDGTSFRIVPLHPKPCRWIDRVPVAYSAFSAAVGSTREARSAGIKLPETVIPRASAMAAT